MEKQLEWIVRKWVWTGDINDPYEPVAWYYETEQEAREQFEAVQITDNIPQVSLLFDDGEQYVMIDIKD